MSTTETVQATAEAFIDRLAKPRTVAILALTAFAAIAMTVLPGFEPKAEAQQAATQPIAKVQTTPIAVASTDCVKQDWPNISASCLRRTDDRPVVTHVRMVTPR